jgi:hypothetical protein
MRGRQLIGILVMFSFLAACAGQQQTTRNLPEKGDPSFFKVRDSYADEVYINEDITKAGWLDAVRRIYLAPANTSTTQIVQPHGVRGSDLDAWEMTDAEEEVLQSKFVQAMTTALERDHAFYVVADKAEAQVVLHSRVIAVHPYQPRSVVAAGGKGGGAVTMSFTLVDPTDDKVMAQILDSKSTDDIWAFDNMDDGKTALDLIFSAWGNQIWRSLLFLQGRLDATPLPLQVKEQG